MKEAINSKTIAGAVAVVLLALAFIPNIAVVASSPPPSCNTVLIDLKGLQGNPSNPAGAVPFTLELIGGSIPPPRGTLTLGALGGSYNITKTVIYTVMGGYQFNTATGKLLAKVVGTMGTTGFEIDLAFLDLPSAGFTFQGIIHIIGQQPQMLANLSGTGLTCS
jgi:hypothetical protein